MKFFLNINQVVIFNNDWHKSSDLNTWALFDFLCFFNNADGHKTLNDGEFKWINYKYIIESLPLCDFYNQKIKKHLDILASFGLIALEKDESNNIYFKLLPKHRMLFEDSYLPSEKSTDPLVKNYLPPRENFTYNNNKESIMINNNNYNTPEFNKLNSTPKEKNQNRFNEFWSLYPKKVSKQKSEQLYLKAIKEVTEEFLINTLKKQIQVWSANKTSIEFIPHCTTWLNQKRYCDDFDTLLKQSNNNQPVKHQTQFSNETRIRTGREIAEEIERERNQQQ